MGAGKKMSEMKSNTLMTSLNVNNQLKFVNVTFYSTHAIFYDIIGSAPMFAKRRFFLIHDVRIITNNIMESNELFFFVAPHHNR